MSFHVCRLSEENGIFFVEFVPQDVGTYIMDVFAGGQKLSDSPVFYKVYDATLIRITEAGSGVVGQPCQFKVDASQAVNNINMLPFQNISTTNRYVYQSLHKITYFQSIGRGSIRNINQWWRGSESRSGVGWRPLFGSFYTRTSQTTYYWYQV